MCRHRHRAVLARVAQRLDEAGQLLVGDFVSGDGQAAERSGDGPAEHDRRCDRERSGRKREEPVGDDVAVCGGLLLTRLREQTVLDRGLDLATEVERRDAVLLPVVGSSVIGAPTPEVMTSSTPSVVAETAGPVIVRR